MITKQKIIAELKEKCNGCDLPLSLNCELVADIIIRQWLQKNQHTKIDIQHIEDLIYSMKIGIKPSDEDIFLLEAYINELRENKN